MPEFAGFMTKTVDDQRVSVLVLTGFGCAGKTTLLNRLLHNPSLSRTAVLISEFGDVSVDHYPGNKVDDSLVVFDSGCICCSVQGDLLRTLKDVLQHCMHREIDPVERVSSDGRTAETDYPVAFNTNPTPGMPF